MKNVTVLLLFIVASTAGQAQNFSGNSYYYRNGLNLRVGPEIGFAAGDFNQTHGMGIGATALLDIPLLSRLSLIVHTGLVSFSGDVVPDAQGIKYRRTNVIPIRTGINYKLTPALYAGVQAGHASVRHLGISRGGFSQSLGLGYFRNRLDLAARWDHQYVHGGLSSINLKAAYVLRFSRNRR
jgi:hypothetical protein